jgi:Zn-dependent peptidase ImmA (M78 family)
MKPLQEFYRIAKEQNIVVDRFALSSREALSLMDTDGQCFIAIDPRRIINETDERNKLAHELGHCVTGSFYNRYSKYDCRQRHENRADKWAIHQLITEDALDQAVAEGHTEVWDLAEHFGVTEQFIKKAISLYVHGNVAEELYF